MVQLSTLSGHLLESLTAQATKLNHLLYADMWGPSTKVDGRLLDRVYKLASDACDGKSLTARQLNIPDQDWFVIFGCKPVGL